MTQLAVARTKENIVIGVDSKAVYYSDKGSKNYINNVTKLLRLAPEVLVAVAGSGHGIRLTEQFLQHSMEQGFWNYEDIVRRAILFFRERLPVVQLQLREESRHPDLERFYFIFMGKNYRKKDNLAELRSHVLLSEGLNEPLRLIEVKTVLTIPRQIGLEYILSRAIIEQKSVSYIRSVMLKYMQKLSERSNDVGPPYQFAILSAQGINLQCIDE